MGIKQLSKLIGEHAPAAIKEITMEALTGRKLAIDASMAIYQFLVAVRSGSRPHHWNFGPMPPVPGLTDEQVRLITAFVRSEQQAVGIR